MNEPFDLVPGDRVTFRGAEWEVFITPRGPQGPMTPIDIFRYEHPGQASDVIDLIRPRCELVLIPRPDVSPSPRRATPHHAVPGLAMPRPTLGERSITL